MTDRPIILADWQVRAILEHRFSQWRVPLVPQPEIMLLASEHLEDYELRGWHCEPCGEKFAVIKRLPFTAGDRLWGRETFTLTDCDEAIYRVDACDQAGDRWISIQPGDPNRFVVWTSSAQMPRRASRITLPTESVRVERVQDATERDLIAEGLEVVPRCSINLITGKPEPGYFITLSDGKRIGGSLGPRIVYEQAWNARYAKKGLGYDANPWTVVGQGHPVIANIDQIGD